MTYRNNFKKNKFVGRQFPNGGNEKTTEKAFVQETTVYFLIAIFQVITRPHSIHKMLSRLSKMTSRR